MSTQNMFNNRWSFQPSFLPLKELGEGGVALSITQTFGLAEADTISSNRKYRIGCWWFCQYITVTDQRTVLESNARTCFVPNTLSKEVSKSCLAQMDHTIRILPTMTVISTEIHRNTVVHRKIGTKLILMYMHATRVARGVYLAVYCKRWEYFGCGRDC